MRPDPSLPSPRNPLFLARIVFTRPRREGIDTAAVKKRVGERRRLAELKEHPRRAEMFGGGGGPELEALAERVGRHGQRDAVEAASDGTVIAGYQRVRAAKSLGWKKIDVVIRRDLEAEGPGAVERPLAEDDFARRRRGLPARVRHVRRLVVPALAARSGRRTHAAPPAAGQ